MANDYTTLNVGTGGDNMDEEGVTYGSAPTTRKRARVQITGATESEIGRVQNSDPDGSEYALVTRNINSGTQTVTGTVTAVPTGTQVVSGTVTVDTVTAVPTGTQAISGTVTAVPTGTQAISGTVTVDTVTAVPTGTQTIAGTVTAVGFTYAEDAAHSSSNTGAFVLAVRNDSFSALTTTDGDYSPIAVDSAGRIGITGTVVPTGTQTVAGTVTIVPTGTQAISGTVTVDTVTAVPTGTQAVSGTVTAVPTGTQAISGTVTVDTVTAVPTGTQTVAGTITAVGFTFAEDAAHSSGNTGAFVLAVRNDSFSALTTTDGDYSPIAVDSAGRIGITGTVVPTGTQTVAGTVTAVPTGTQIVTGTVETTVTVNTDFSYAEDATHTTGDIGAFVLAVRNDSFSALTNTNGDYSPIAVDSAGRVGITGTVSTLSGGDFPAAENIVCTYGMTETIASAGTGTVTYTTGTAGFYLKSVLASSSGGPCKVSVLYDTSTVLATKFYNSNNPSVDINFAQAFLVGSGTEVAVVITNNAGATQDLYASIIGYQL